MHRHPDGLPYPRRAVTAAACLVLVLCVPGAQSSARADDAAAHAPGAAVAAAPQPRTCVNDAGLTLPPGFCASIFADHLGQARDIAVTPNGVVYVNTRAAHGQTPPEAGFLVALEDTRGTGRADVVRRFGPTEEQGGHGGTGIALYKGWLFAEEKDRIERYTLSQDSIVPKGPATDVVYGLPLTGDHPMHPFVIDKDGNLFVDLGSATNSCQSRNR
jgi:glucose/arabinose dehydrogenase